LRRKREEMQKFWAWTLKTRPSWRESKVEAAVAFTVLGATGTGSKAAESEITNQGES
jgi:hypothetical protein